MTKEQEATIADQTRTISDLKDDLARLQYRIDQMNEEREQREENAPRRSRESDLVRIASVFALIASGSMPHETEAHRSELLTRAKLIVEALASFEG